ncbi:MAG: radical SAM/SPASM domain-containing protein [bacterium]
MFKDKIASFLLAKFNLNNLSDLVGRYSLLKIPYKFFSQRMISYDFPLHIFAETTSACNLKCKICPRTKGNTLIGNMDFELFKRIVDEANSYGPRTFSLHLFGEPLLAPNFSKMIKYIKQTNKANTIILTTNGTLLNEKIAKDIIEAPVDKITISFTSATKDNYEKITSFNKLETFEKNILNLIKLKKSKKATKPCIYVRMIVNKNNKNEEKLFKNKWKNQPLIVEARPAHNYGGYTPEASFRKDIIKKTKRYPCYHLWLSPAIHWNGDVSVCCDDWGRKALLGNIKNQTIHQIWNSEKIKRYRQYHLKGLYEKVPLCGKCDVWTMYEDIFFDWQKKKK